MLRSAAVATCGLVISVGCAPGPAPGPGDPTPEPPGLGAVRELEEAEWSGQHLESVEDMLRGRVPGLQVLSRPNGELALRIRGTDSLDRTVREPLLVIDGMAVSSTDVGRALNSLIPSQIRSIRVLRDVSSTSVYGLRGANGVILITTSLE